MANTIDWGQGAVNNTIDWGKGKTNATNNWGAIYDSTAAGETNITGSGGVTPFVNEYSMTFDGVDEYFNGASTFSDLDGSPFDPSTSKSFLSRRNFIKLLSIITSTLFMYPLMNSCTSRRCSNTNLYASPSNNSFKIVILGSGITGLCAGAILSKLGYDEDRIWLKWISASEGKLFADTVTQIVEELKQKGPNPIKRMWTV